MHLPDGFLSLPVSVSALSVSALYGIYSHKKVSKRFKENSMEIPKIGCTAAFIFAAQMLNFPVLSGTSGHFLGAAFSTLLFGPFVSFFIMATVFLVQALFFADGGILAYGCNLFLMGIVAPNVAYISFALFKRVLKKRYASIILSSLISVVVTAAACAFLLYISGTVPLMEVLLAMTSVHFLIGIGEGIITASAICFLMSTKVFYFKELGYES